MSGGVCDLPNERCFHPISCSERGCVKQRSAPRKHPELRGEKLNAHCPYDEATLRQDMTYPDRGICPVCFTSLLKPLATPATPA